MKSKFLVLMVLPFVFACGSKSSGGKGGGQMLRLSESCDAGKLIQDAMVQERLVEISPNQYAAFMNAKPGARWTVTRNIVSENTAFLGTWTSQDRKPTITDTSEGFTAVATLNEADPLTSTADISCAYSSEKIGGNAASNRSVVSTSVGDSMRLMDEEVKNGVNITASADRDFSVGDQTIQLDLSVEKGSETPDEDDVENLKQLKNPATFGNYINAALSDVSSDGCKLSIRFYRSIQEGRLAMLVSGRCDSSYNTRTEAGSLNGMGGIVTKRLEIRDAL